MKRLLLILAALLCSSTAMADGPNVTALGSGQTDGWHSGAARYSQNACYIGNPQVYGCFVAPPVLDIWRCFPDNSPISAGLHDGIEAALDEAEDLGYGPSVAFRGSNAATCDFLEPRTGMGKVWARLHSNFSGNVPSGLDIDLSGMSTGGYSYWDQATMSFNTSYIANFLGAQSWTATQKYNYLVNVGKATTLRIMGMGLRNGSSCSGQAKNNTYSHTAECTLSAFDQSAIGDFRYLYFTGQ